MLVLTRKSNQSIMIGDDIEVSVLSVMGEKVRIGIQAPQEVPVFRKEIYLEIHRERGVPAAERPRGSAQRRSAAAISESRAHRGQQPRGREPSTVPRYPARRPATLAEQQVERAEHHDGDDHRGRGSA